VTTLIQDGYVLDTSAIIDLWRIYPPKTFRNLWKRVERLVQEGRLISPGQVLVELKRKDDDAAGWLKDRKDVTVVRENAAIWSVAQKVANDNLGLVDSKKTGAQADPFVIALAMSRGWTVVTSEKAGGFGKVNIPSVCKRVGVPCLTILQLFEKEGWEL
jgi:Domain of unknown function (DUF4411)